MKKRTLTLVVALVLVSVMAVGGTLAWLTAQTQTVTNTFTVGDINIDLAETNVDGESALENSYKMVPGNTIDKDPKVTVKAGSETCYLFVKVKESGTLDTYITYGIAGGWTALDSVTGVYYRTVMASDSDQIFDILDGNKVTVNAEVTKADMEALKAAGAEQPTLAFMAAAVQTANIDNVNDAYEATPDEFENF